MAKVYISLGTNLGDKEQNLRTAVQKIEEQVGKVISLECGGVYRNETVASGSAAEDAEDRTGTGAYT